jgi:hypothetical protein
VPPEVVGRRVRDHRAPREARAVDRTRSLPRSVEAPLHQEGRLQWGDRRGSNPRQLEPQGSSEGTEAARETPAGTKPEAPKTGDAAARPVETSAAHSPPVGDAVEAALAKALDEASVAGRWDVVAQLARARGAAHGEGGRKRRDARREGPSARRWTGWVRLWDARQRAKQVGSCPARTEKPTIGRYIDSRSPLRAQKCLPFPTRARATLTGSPCSRRTSPRVVDRLLACTGRSA